MNGDADIDNESISVIYFEKLGVQFHLAFLSYHIFSWLSLPGMVHYISGPAHDAGFYYDLREV